MKMRILLCLTVGSLLVGGCSNDSPGADGLKLKMKAVTSLSTINGRTKASDLVFNQILVGVQKIEFETNEENESEDINGEDDNEEVEFRGNYVVDLINGTSTPDFGLTTVQPGLYDELEIKMGPILENGNTAFIAFTYTPDGGSAVQVEFSTQEEIEIEIENEAGYQLDASVLSNILVLLNLDGIFADVDLSQAEVDQDGVIRINDTSNQEIAQQILSGLGDSFEAGEDNDHNDDIDED